jgi:PAS domain S-box-containing protein
MKKKKVRKQPASMRKDAAIGLQDSKEIYRTLVENISLGITLIDTNYRIIITNAGQGRILKKAQNKFVGKYCFKEFEKRDAVCSHCPGTRAMATGRPADVETEGVRDDGSRVPARVHAFPVYEADGTVKGFIEVIEDISERKQTEEALKESQEMYKTLFEGASEGILVADIKTKRFRYANPAVCKMLGYAEKELKQLSVPDIHPKKELQHVISEFEAQARGEKSLAEAIPCLRKDGTVIHADINTANLLIDGTQCNVGFFTDITERKKTEEELLFKTALLEAQSETSIDGILVVNNEGKSLLFNKQFGQMWNIPQRVLNTRDDEKMLQCVLRRLKEPDKFLERVKYLYAHKDEKSRDEIQFKDGKVFDRYSSPLRDSTGKHYGRIWYFMDITQRKKAEEARRLSEEKFAKAFNSSPAAIFITTLKEGRFIDLNEIAIIVFGYTREEVVGHTAKELNMWANYNDRDIVVQSIRRGIAVRNMEARFRRKSGEVFDCIVSVDIINIGGTECLISTIIDITERKHTEQKLKKARDELEIRVRERTADLEKAVEKLRNEVSERKKAEEKLLTYQKQLRSSASELSLAEERLRRKIATDVHDHLGQNLAISKLKIESLAQSATSPALAEALEEVRDLIAQAVESTRSLTFELSPPILYELGFGPAVQWLLRQTRQQHGLSTEFTDDERPKPLDDDIRVLLFQAVRELLVNVVKHAKAGSVKVSTQKIDDQIQVSIEDDGVGFDVDQLYSQDHLTSGFGLFNIRERLNHIGGHLDIASGAGKGTRVTMVAPTTHKKEKSKEKRK